MQYESKCGQESLKDERIVALSDRTLTVSHRHSQTVDRAREQASCYLVREPDSPQSWCNLARESDSNLARESDINLARESDSNLARESDSNLAREPDSNLAREPDYHNQSVVV